MQKYMFVYHDKNDINTHALFYDTFSEVEAVADAFKAIGFEGIEIYVRVGNEYKKMD